MGRYISHPLNGMREKIGVCRGNDPACWHTWYDKPILEELRRLGFQGECEGGKGQDSLALFIENYDRMDTTVLLFKRLVTIAVAPGDFEALRDELVGSGACLVIPQEAGPMLVTDEHYILQISEIATQLGINIAFTEYESPSAQRSA